MGIYILFIATIIAIHGGYITTGWILLSIIIGIEILIISDVIFSARK